MESENILMAFLFLVSGLVAILFGANWLTDGASSVAKRLRVSDLVIGLTIVAFGTSAPELVVSLISAFQGSSDMAIGNVVGSNIFNTLLIVGCTAVLVPFGLSKGTLRREIPLCILASFVLFFCASDTLIDGDEINLISRSDGLILLGFFFIFFAYTMAIARDGISKKEEQVVIMPLWRSILFLAFGLVALIFGGHFFVEGASKVARSLGVSESTIGLTLVAGGTSVPELATSIVAALKKNPQMAIGNAIGSNLFNIFFVLGVSASVHPLEVRGITLIDFTVMTASCILLYIFGRFFKKRTITRWEGAIMVGCFFLYMTHVIMAS